MKARSLSGTLIATATFVALCLVLCIWFAQGVTVTVRNGGNSPLIDLQVHVTGRSYNLGNLESGAMKRCAVEPTSESHVEISYQLPDGTSRRHSIGGYLEPGYRGTVDAEIQDGEMVQSSHRIRGLFF
ncbi:MAG: hypothetical protein ACK553_00285 [Planctomycetota bacterium]|jgi:hypothetical protein